MKAWWRSVAAEYQLQDAGYLLLQYAAESWDLAQMCRKTLRKEGLLVQDPKQGTKAHPLVAVRRDATATFQRCLKQLGLEE
jgi:P27 family predicted phage terminase small subunit